MSKIESDLQRFLFLVPYVAQHPRGVPIAELCERLDINRKKLTRLLDRVVAVGTPDGAPDEMVELYLEGERVFVSLPQKFVRPPRFSVDEMLALLLVLAPLRSSGTEVAAKADALSEQLTTLASQRAERLAGDLKTRVRVDPAGLENPEHLRDLERAIEETREIDAEYYTATRDDFGARILRPRALLSHSGVWYVIDDEGKRFRVERFRSVELTDRSFTPGDDVDVEALMEGSFFQNAPIEVELRVEGERTMSRAQSVQSLRTFAITGRGRVEVIAPQDARDATLAEAQFLLDRYQ